MADAFSVTQTTPGSLNCRYSIRYDGGDSSYSYEILGLDEASSSWWTKASGILNSSGRASGTISFDYFRSYTVMCQITHNGALMDTLFATASLVDESDEPEPFSWTTPKVAGEPFNLTAAEWNAFTAKINEVRAYRGYGQAAFTRAVTGAKFTAEMFNEAVLRIEGAEDYVQTVSAGDDVTAAYMNGIVAALNAWI